MSESLMVDKNSMRFGAGFSAAVLLVAFLFEAVWVIPVFAVVLGIGSVMGLPASPLGALYRAVKSTFKLQIPVEREDAAPPRFAQTLGFVFLGVASVAYIVFGAAGFAWTLALLVAGLQALLASTGLCVGCEIYLLSKRFAAKGA